ncbi:Brix [Nesidiocoris tenuis]|uniref:Brix n=1 Tax=Nesidiocoris tenuis TaxID=355587 RepID=A0ABN7AL16_9HEMI|nr:Brix [Nesidiocoris tenuis]
MGKKKKGRCVKHNKQIADLEPESLTRAPHSFVFTRGTAGKYVYSLMKSFRKIMEPFTASQLRVRKKNSIKDLLSVTGPLHVSHFVMFTVTDVAPYLRIAKVPRGPTLTFKIHKYILARDVASSSKKQFDHPRLYLNSPLVILNGFNAEDSDVFRLMIATLQGMFPNINVAKVDLNNVKRCVLFNYDPEKKTIDFRHYAINVKPVGVAKSVKKLMANKVPNLSRFEDVADFIQKGDLLSDSEGEDDPASHVELPQALRAKGAIRGNKSAIRLMELGPRMTLQLIKVEDGLMDGEVMYHEYVHKTEEEKAEILKRREERKKLKLKRKQTQMENVRKKELAKEEAKKKSLEGMAQKKAAVETESDKLMKEAAAAGAIQEDDDDAEWYRKEIGQEPDAELFGKPGKSSLKRKREDSNFKPYKRAKTSGQKKKVSFANDGDSGKGRGKQDGLRGKASGKRPGRFNDADNKFSRKGGGKGNLSSKKSFKSKPPNRSMGKFKSNRRK